MRDMLDPDYEPECNASDNKPFAEIMAARFGRRGFLKGSLGAAVGGLFATTGVARALEAGAGPALNFEPVPVDTSDAFIVPEGYEAKVIYRWGDPVTGAMPEFSPHNTGAEQGEQAGMHHDGMHFFPIEGQDPWQGSSTDGLLVVNHEYIEPRFLHAGKVEGQAMTAWSVPDHAGPRDPDMVLKELNAHGVSVARIREDADGEWRIVPDPRNRRITALTEMEIAGPVRGSDLVKTKFSPEGERTRGTFANCAHGVTPWNTYMAAEENWSGAFVNNDAELPREHARYGVRQGMSRPNWHLAADGADGFVRFDASTKADSAEGDYRNEPNGFGWMVEIDPFDPDSTPVKRTTLGRCAHEGVVFAPVNDGEKVVCYTGDDARNEYIYKFVSAGTFRRGVTRGEILDEGVLYVAKFHDDGTGEWLALVHGQNGLDESNGFVSQADVLVNTRLAADFVGATPMDRPEWGTVDPETRAVYFTLTNNSQRTADDIDGANPRGPNPFGHIIRWHEDGGQEAQTFTWDLFVIAGPHEDSADMHGEALTDDNIFSSPDGLWMDANRRLWIQTDISESVMYRGNHTVFGNNAMLAANPETGEIKRFLTGPVGQEITGVVTTPDHRTIFVNVQHPGATTSAEDFASANYASHWPDGGNAIPRSATVMIRRTDRGVIGA
ncbi:PhoX family phosphatase [Alkalicaulis satelles]|uniref:PhoX family phosphatase n=1 Tax=Alkalicaulis satelles TaxID=2609175 RepID=A0A5M6ZID6_9PROT|nr:PhoX family phosphatase [Alkalicaulis satelles]KAA5804583.1 PhoX family phosphatase [Alkalicaulis satelles]